MISSIDSVFVRAAASSIASGRPSSERHSSSHRVAGLVATSRARGATGEQLDGVGERERRELEHGLAVDVERHLAGAQDPQPGGGVEEADRERRGRVDDVLAVVEDHHGGAALEPLEQRRLAAGDVQRGDQRVEDVVGRRRGFEPRQPDAAGRLRRALGRSRSRPPSCRCRPARRSRRAARSASRSDSGGDLRLAPDELGRHRRQVPGGRAIGRRAAPGRGCRICCSSCCSRGPGSRPSSSASRVRTRW